MKKTLKLDSAVESAARKAKMLKMRSFICSFWHGITHLFFLKKRKKTALSTAHLIELKQGSSFKAPVSWKAEDFNHYLKMTSPEKDLTLYFLEIQAVQTIKTQNIETVIIEAWKKIHPEFDLKTSQHTYTPPTQPWDILYQVLFDTPLEKSCIVAAHASCVKNQAYICLGEGKISSFASRYAEISIMVESWKPADFIEADLGQQTPKTWLDADRKDFEHFFKKTMEKFQIPGAAIQIINQAGQKIYSQAFGVKSLNGGEPVTLDTPFIIGSTTKPLTTLLMARLVDQNKLSWETLMTDLLPDFHLADADLTKKLQIQHTVSASTGMPRQDLEFIFKYQNVTPEERLAQMRNMRPTTKLGETFQYSNFLFMAGGYAAAHLYAPKETLENAYIQAMNELIFKPLGMQNTVIKTEDALKLGAALPHALNLEGKICQIPLELENCVYSVAPAGAVWSTVEDLSQYLLLEMNQGRLHNKRIMDESALLKRRQPGIQTGDQAFYGLGLLISTQQGLTSVGHDGGSIGFSSHLSFLPEKGIGITLLTNSDQHQFLSAIKQKFLELSFQVKSLSDEMVDIALNEQKEIVQQRLNSISFDLDKLHQADDWLGEYTSSSLGNMTFKKTKGQYEMIFDEWKTQIGCEIDSNGKMLLVLTTSPWPGTFKFQMAPEKLFLDFQQQHYEFIKRPAH